MKLTYKFEVTDYEFSDGLLAELYNSEHADCNWPVVYILSDKEAMEAYVGETTDTRNRMSTHLKHPKKKKLTTVHLVTSYQFNKSATLDIEADLIKYLAGDGQFALMNGNLGLGNHTYYQKAEYERLFHNLWEELRSNGIARHSLKYINNTDLFKYSPYKTLSGDQRHTLYTMLQSLLDADTSVVVAEGGAGTGKSILAVFLFKLLQTNIEDFNFEEFGNDEVAFVELVRKLKRKYTKPKMGLIVPVSSFRGTLQRVFKQVAGLHQSMVIGPAELAKKPEQPYDILLVDEAHRLRRRVNLGSYYKSFDIACAALKLKKESCSELDWVLQQSAKAILFYDAGQSIKPSDAPQEAFDRLKESPSTRLERLISQFRMKGGNAYEEFLKQLLRTNLPKNASLFRPSNYSLLLFDSIADMIEQIKQREQDHQLCRLFAGFAWPWASNPKKKEPAMFDMIIEGIKLRWNGTTIDWIHSKNAANEVGCIHTAQGYEVNYAGIIFGPEIIYNPQTEEIQIIKANYHDRNGKNTITDPLELKEKVLNIYDTMLKRGILGSYVYACDEHLHNYLARYIPQPTKKPQITYLPTNDVVPFVNCIPLFDLNIAAGEFGQYQQVDELDWIALPSPTKPSEELFACKVVGESMNKLIPSNSVCLFRKYTAGSRNGLIVLVELTEQQDTDMGSYTVKEYHSKKISTGDSYKHVAIVLRPLSDDTSFADIELIESETHTYRVLGTFVKVLS